MSNKTTDKIYVGNGVEKFDGDLVQFSLNLTKLKQEAGDYIFDGKTGDKFISITEVEDAIFFCVERSINSSTVYYLEKLDYTSTLDCNITKTGSEITAWTGLSHLEGESVDILDNVDTTHGGTYTVASAAITSTAAHSNVDIGFDFAPTITTLPVEFTLSIGTILGELKRIARVNLAVVDSYTWTIGSNVVPLYEVTDDLSAAPVAKTGTYEFFILGYDKLGQVTITQDAPLPLTILGIEKEVVF